MPEEDNNTNPNFTTENAIRLTVARNAEEAVVPDKNGNQRTKEFPVFSESAYRDLDVYKIDINLVYFNFEQHFLAGKILCLVVFRESEFKVLFFVCF